MSSRSESPSQLQVIDTGRGLGGTCGGQALAAHGADVIKSEPPRAESQQARIALDLPVTWRPAFDASASG